MTTSPKDEEQLTALDADDDPETHVGEELASEDGIFNPDDEDESGEVDETPDALSVPEATESADPTSGTTVPGNSATDAPGGA